MGFFKKLKKILVKAAPVAAQAASMFPGAPPGLSRVLGGVGMAGGLFNQPQPGAGFAIPGTISPRGFAPGAIGAAAARFGPMIARTAATGAAAYGLSRVFGGDGAAAPRKRRARGITAAELRGYKKVSKLMCQLPAPPARKRASCSTRRKC